MMQPSLGAIKMQDLPLPACVGMQAAEATVCRWQLTAAEDGSSEPQGGCC